MIYLASKSPRRMALLQQINVDYRCLAVDIDESRHENEKVDAYVRRLALQKARAGQALLDGDEKKIPVLAADTIVLLNNEVMGKPHSKQDGISMLQKLSGKSHQVLTAVALCSLQLVSLEVSRSTVTFREVSTQEIELYWDSGEPKDKAGAYGIQGLGAIFISNINGSYSGVMGLPLYETSQLLAKV